MTAAFRVDVALDVLSRTPAVLRALLSELPDELSAATEGPDTWSPYDIVGHLIHGERTDWVSRARIILAGDGSKTFEPFDRFAQFTESRGKSLGDLLDEFETLRARNLQTVRDWALGPDSLALGARHPDFGPVTLQELLATWMVHDLNHLRQIARVMAKQYGREVGPWARYLPVLAEPQK